MLVNQLKKLFFLFALGFLANQAQGQNLVGINTNSPQEALDINGTMRVRKLPTNGERNAVNQGRATFTRQFQVIANESGVLGREDYVAPPPTWFYMPPINLPMTTDDPRYSAADQFFTVNLYDEYKKQFAPTSPNSLVTTAGAAPLPTYEANALDYFVTYYDVSVFKDVSLAANGVLKYRIKDIDKFTPDTFFNIIFRVR